MSIFVSKLLHAAGNAVVHSKVRLALLDALGTDALRMEIDVTDGDVSLAGKVRGAGNCDRAAEVARKVGGVKSVKTDLVLEGSDAVAPVDTLATELADRKLEAKVRLKLLEEFDAPALKVRVAASNGAVTLSGDMDSQDLRARAEDTVKGIVGVSRIINNIPSGGR